MVLGIGLGYVHSCYNKSKWNNSLLNKIKFVELIIICLLTPTIFGIYHLGEAKYIFILSFGYIC